MESLQSALHLPETPYNDEARSHISIFDNCPFEIIRCIFDYLSPESALSFAISSRTIYQMYGSHIKTLARASDTFEFLATLARDLPNHVPCYDCKKLHGMDKVHQHIISAAQSSLDISWWSCWQPQVDKPGSTLGVLPRNFSFTIFQMAMKRFCQGRDCWEFLNLLSVEDICLRTPCCMEYQVATPRIIDGSLILKRERMFTKPPCTGHDPSVERSTIATCPHMLIRWDSYAWGMMDIEVQFPTGRGAGWWQTPDFQNTWQGVIRRCNYCQTDFSLDVKRSEKTKVPLTIFATTWQDLGDSGSSMDHKWKSHTQSHGVHPPMLLEWDRSSVCDRFEGRKLDKILWTDQDIERITDLHHQTFLGAQGLPELSEADRKCSLIDRRFEALSLGSLRIAGNERGGPKALIDRSSI